MSPKKEISILLNEYFRVTRWDAIKNAFALSSEWIFVVWVCLILAFSLMGVFSVLLNNNGFFGGAVVSGLVSLYVYLNGISGVDPGYRRRRLKIIKTNIRQLRLKVGDVDRDEIEERVMFEISKTDIDRRRAVLMSTLFIGMISSWAFTYDREKFVFIFFFLLFCIIDIDHHYYYIKRGGKVKVIVDEVMDIIQECKKN